MDLDRHDDIAGEYVLGVLDHADRQAFSRLIATDAGVQHQVAAWTDRLTPILDRIAETPAPASVWQAIDASIGAAPKDRMHNEGGWLDMSPGITAKFLRVDPITGERTALYRLAAGAGFDPHHHDSAEECLVMEGAVLVGGKIYEAGDYVCEPAGSSHDRLSSTHGAMLLLHWCAVPAGNAAQA